MPSSSYNHTTTSSSGGAGSQWQTATKVNKSPKQSNGLRQRLNNVFMPGENGGKSLSDPQLKKVLVCGMTFSWRFSEIQTRERGRTLQHIKKRQQNFEFEIRLPLQVKEACSG